MTASFDLCARGSHRQLLISLGSRHERCYRLQYRRLFSRSIAQANVGENSGDDRYFHRHRADLLQPIVSGCSLSIRCRCWCGNRIGLSRVLHGDPGGYSEIRRSSRSENPGGREARAGSTPGSVFAESLTSASPSTFSTKTWVSSSTLS